MIWILAEFVDPVGQPGKRAGPQPGADVVDQRLFGAVAEKIVDLAVPCEHGGAEIDQLRGEVVSVLILRVDAGGCQPTTPRSRQDAGGHECVPRAVAAEVHPDVDAPRAAGLVRRPEETPIPGGNAVCKRAVDDAARCSPLAEDKAVIVDRARVLLFSWVRWRLLIQYRIPAR